MPISSLNLSRNVNAVAPSCVSGRSANTAVSGVPSLAVIVTVAVPTVAPRCAAATDTVSAPSSLALSSTARQRRGPPHSSPPARVSDSADTV